jgi:tetratricopeptide (TPR) repeat protein
MIGVQEADKAVSWLDRLFRHVRRRRLRVEQLRDVGVDVLRPSDLKTKPQANERTLSSAYIHGAIDHSEFTLCVRLGIPAERLITRSRLPKQGPLERLRLPGSRKKKGAGFAGGLACREILGLPRAGLTTALAQIAVTEASDRMVLFARWPELERHLPQAAADDELRRLIGRRFLSLRRRRWRRPLLILDDCPPRTLNSAPDPVLLRFLTMIKAKKVPVVLGVKLSEEDASPGQLGYLEDDCRRHLRIRPKERLAIVDRWLDLAEEASGPGSRSVDRKKLHGWLNDRFFVYRNSLPLLLWLVSRHRETQLFDNVIAQAHRSFQQLDEETRSIVEAYSIVASVRPAAANLLMTEPGTPAAEAIARWHMKIDDIATGGGKASPTAHALVSFEIAETCLQEDRLVQVLDMAMDRHGVQGERDAAWRLVVRGLVLEMSPATATMEPRSREKFKSEIRNLAIKHCLLEAPADGLDPNSRLAIAATARALGDRSSAAKLYRELLDEAEWLEDVERPEWFWPSLLIGLRDTSQATLGSDKCKPAVLECERLRDNALPPKMALGLARAISTSVEMSEDIDPAECGSRLLFAEELNRAAMKDPGTRRHGANAIARLVGGLSGPYAWNGLPRPNLEEAVEWAQMAFAGDPPARDNPSQMVWQDVITHHLLGAIYRHEFERTGERLPDADRHYQLSLEAALTRELDTSQRRQLNHVVRSCTGYGLWWHRRGDDAEAERWYNRAVDRIEALPPQLKFEDMSLAYLRRDLFWEIVHRDPEVRIQGIVDGLQRLPPDRIRTNLEARLRRLKRDLQGG